jgi:hypothetical protein
VVYKVIEIVDINKSINIVVRVDWCHFRDRNQWKMIYLNKINKYCHKEHK